MLKSTIEAGVVSWELFDALYESQADFLRKLKFLVKAGRATEEEGLALDIVFDQLNSKEQEIISLREKAVNLRQTINQFIDHDKNGRINWKHTDISETMSILEKLESIRQEGGYPWENIRSIIEGTYSSMRQKTEKQ